MIRLVIIGGSTPFTAHLVNALAEQADHLRPHNLVFVGRNRENLALMAEYAHGQLDAPGWHIGHSSDLRSALQGANIVVHQARYGGMETRAIGESISLAFRVAPDETLGPGALYCAIQLIPELDSTSAMLARECPDAWVLNLTNPLSLTTARMIHMGVQRCVGLCELPRVTFEQVASTLGKNASDGNWSYSGLNHRGFITELRFDGRCHIAEFAQCLGSATFNGMSADHISALGAIPTKYFSLFAMGRKSDAKPRSTVLSQLRERLKRELQEDPHRSPPSLYQRDMAWYDRAVVPMIAALSAELASLQEVNQLGESGLVEEGRSWVSEGGIGELTEVAPPVAAVCNWLNTFRGHERLAMRAVREPGLDTISAALNADPLMRPEEVEACASHIWTELKLNRRFAGPSLQ